jgi:hypothetical protein
MLSYMDLQKLWEPHSCPFTQLDVNKGLSDRYPTSWSVHRGHHFYIWVKTARSVPNMLDYYTRQRRIAPDAPPPYPPHPTSLLGSLLPTRLAIPKVRPPAALFSSSSPPDGATTTPLSWSSLPSTRAPPSFSSAFSFNASPRHAPAPQGPLNGPRNGSRNGPLSSRPLPRRQAPPEPSPEAVAQALAQRRYPGTPLDQPPLGALPPRRPEGHPTERHPKQAGCMVM